MKLLRFNISSENMDNRKINEDSKQFIKLVKYINYYFFITYISPIKGKKYIILKKEDMHFLIYAF